MRVLVFGGDGYLGWPLSLTLSSAGHEVLIVDNLMRRRLVAAHGATLFDLPAPRDRVVAANGIIGNRISVLEADLSEVDLAPLLRDFGPDLIYNLAQQPSASYAMRGRHAALQTIRNNELSNVNLLWAVREVAPQVPIVKMASFGAYADCGIDIKCGYVHPEIDGQRADRPVLFPMEADDIYHITKINDAQFDAMACRKWGLRIVEVMQSTVFGLHADPAFAAAGLHSRFDYDPTFGTILNRFMLQAACGMPITVYGTGHQRTGLISLSASVRSLAGIALDLPRPGHHYFNNVTIKDLSVLEIAQAVVDVARAHGIAAKLETGCGDPRNEELAEKRTHAVESSLGISERLGDFFPQFADLVASHGGTLRRDFLRAGTAWSVGGAQGSCKDASSLAEELPQRIKTAGAIGLQRHTQLIPADMGARPMREPARPAEVRKQHLRSVV